MKKREAALRLVLFLLISLAVVLHILRRERVPELAPIPQPTPTPLVWEQDCQEVYPTDMEMAEVGKWLSEYWDFLVLEGTGEVGTSQNSPVLFPLPTDGSPKCIIAA